MTSSAVQSDHSPCALLPPADIAYFALDWKAFDALLIDVNAPNLSDPVFETYETDTIAYKSILKLAEFTCRVYVKCTICLEVLCT